MDILEVEKKELYNPVFSTIKSIETLTELEKRFEIALPDNRVLGHNPGQFVEVSIFGFGEAPISICSRWGTGEIQACSGCENHRWDPDRTETGDKPKIYKPESISNENYRWYIGRDDYKTTKGIWGRKIRGTQLCG